LAIEVVFSLASTRVVALLDDWVARRGAPRGLRCDNGLEFIVEALRPRCAVRGITLALIESGELNQNAFIKRFNRTFREEVLDAWVFKTLAEVQTIMRTGATSIISNGHMKVSAMCRPRTSCREPPWGGLRSH
jgi:putative transposase